MVGIPSRYSKALKKINSLQKEERYLGAFIFGSAARGDSTEKSDLDVQVVVNKDNPCKNINHPIIDNVKLDLSFLSFKQLEKRTLEEIKSQTRIPMVAESIVLFDKNGKLAILQKLAKRSKPRKATKKDYQLIQFMVFHADDKAKRNLKDDPETALLAMSINLNDILKIHYQIQGRWWISNKKLLEEIRVNEPKLAKIIEAFLKENNVSKKYELWEKIIDYVLKPIGGRQTISENNCRCKVCKKDLEKLIT